MTPPFRSLLKGQYESNDNDSTLRITSEGSALAGSDFIPDPDTNTLAHRAVNNKELYVPARTV